MGGAHLLDEHISVDALVRRLSLKAQKYVSVFSNLINCCFFVIVFWGATLMSILEANKVSPAAGISMTFFYLPLAICSMILLVYYGIQAVKVKESKEVTKEC
jgi:TRAP-type C4-dicarboxylate transport system permease small subunit